MGNGASHSSSTPSHSQSAKVSRPATHAALQGSLSKSTSCVPHDSSESTREAAPSGHLSATRNTGVLQDAGARAEVVPQGSVRSAPGAGFSSATGAGGVAIASPTRGSARALVETEMDETEQQAAAAIEASRKRELFRQRSKRIALREAKQREGHPRPRLGPRGSAAVGTGSHHRQDGSGPARRGAHPDHHSTLVSGSAPAPAPTTMTWESTTQFRAPRSHGGARGYARRSKAKARLQQQQHVRQQQQAAPQATAGTSVAGTLVPKLPPIGGGPPVSGSLARPSSREYRMMMGEASPSPHQGPHASFFGAEEGHHHSHAGGSGTGKGRRAGDGTRSWRATRPAIVETAHHELPQPARFDDIKVNTLSPLDEMESKDAFSATQVKQSSRWQSRTPKHERGRRQSTPRDKDDSVSPSRRVSMESGSESEGGDMLTGFSSASSRLLRQPGQAMSKWKFQ